ncbi:MAG: acetylornithine transaminase [Deltaproteobacteria bacterium]|nr:acetylornithine transaminase [Deltaproteobacteria bacterium]
MNASPVMELADKVLAKTYGRQPVCLVEGRGTTVVDDQGRSYLDFVGGLAVCILGHSHPAVAHAVCEQARRLVHVSNLYYTVPQAELARWLVSRSFADRVFFCNSGAEANEAAIKLARKAAKDSGHPERFRVVATERSFHGRTLATLSATGQEKIHKGFEPLVEGFSHVPYNDLSAMEAAVDGTVCAVLVEPVQGEGGVCMPDPDYLPGLRRLCDERGVLLVYDEVQTGMGRTGKLFAHEHFSAPPHVMTLAKGLANGLPIGAMLAVEDAAKSFTPGTHATTFGGTPLVCAAALAVAETLEKENILDHCREMGERLQSALKGLAGKFPFVKQVRGLGLMVGMELDRPGGPVVEAMREKGFLINCTQDTVLRFLPPLIVQQHEIDQLVSALSETLAQTA